jgi:flagellin-like hook-associated protein FlgL
MEDEYRIRYTTGENFDEMQLRNVPNADTLEVRVNGQVLEGGYTVDGDTIRFQGDAIPKMGDNIQANYQTGAQFTQINLDEAPTEDTVSVFVDGQELAMGAENGFTVDGNRIQFHGEGIPDLGQEVRVNYGLGEWMDNITLDMAPNAGGVNVTIDGVAIQEDAQNGFTVQDNEVTLHGAARPQAGQEVKVEYDIGPETDAITSPTGLGSYVDIDRLNLSTAWQGLDNFDYESEGGIKRAIEDVDNALDFLTTEQVKYGAQENRFAFSIEALQDKEANVMKADSELRHAEMENEIMNYFQAQLMSNLAYTMLAQANMNPDTAMSLLSPGLMGGGGGLI